MISQVSGSVASGVQTPQLDSPTPGDNSTIPPGPIIEVGKGANV